MSALRRILAAAPAGQLRLVGAATIAERTADAAALRQFHMAAYNGGIYRFPWSRDPVVLDLTGLDLTDRARPILKDHDAAQVVGHSTAILKADTLAVHGVVSGTGPAAVEVVANSDNGFPWQASIGADVLAVEEIAAGTHVTVNAQSFTGPLLIVRKSRLAEVSFVALGNDDSTTAAMTAHASLTHIQGSAIMTFADWLKSLGLDPATLTPEATAELQKAFDAVTAAEQAESDNAPDAPAKAKAARSAMAMAIKAAAHKPSISHGVSPEIAAAREAAAAETERLAGIRAVTGDHLKIQAQAIREGWTVDRAEVAALRASRPTAAAIHANGQPMLTGEIITAAIMQAGRAGQVEHQFTAPVLEAAHRRFRGRISLQEVLLEAARSNGYTGDSVRRDLPGVLRAAFAIQASGFSAVDLPGILSNSMNKFLLDGWLSVEQSWRQIAAVRPLSDFKVSTSYRMSGAAEYEKVNGAGEVKHGTLGDTAYPLKADTYARMLAITRQDIINDDLGAITGAPRHLGRGGALKINDVFWAEFLNNAAFFTSGNGSYFAGSPASLLTIDGLSAAEVLMLNQTDPDGKPLGISPAMLLVPPALKAQAEALYKSLELRDTTANTKAPTANPHGGKFAPVVSAYLSNAKYTGNSALAWYLLANPADLAVMEIGFLNGQESPTIESADADFNTLGIQMRGYHDFGVAKHEYRAGVKAKGQA